LCLDCSATHRSIGVHLTFVRSLDLDEWTQRQMDAMRIGGNGPARAYFRKHGMTLEVGGGSSIKKYQSKSASSYRAELKKLVEAEARKRGEGLPSSEPSSATSTEKATSLLQNLSVGDQMSMETEAKEKLAAARAASDKKESKPTFRPAASLHSGKGKLVMGAGKLQKPGATSTTSAMLLKKKSSSFGANKSRPKVNKLGSAKLTNGANDGFENIEETQRKAAEAEEERKQMEADEAMARQLQQEMDGDGATLSSGYKPTSSSVSSPSRPVQAAPAAAPAVSSEPKITKMEENMARLKAMNSDFFS
jgi:ADP-ribosylation factor GTPase-activating protein 2/3